MYRHLLVAVLSTTVAACASGSSAGAGDAAPPRSSDPGSVEAGPSDSEGSTEDAPPERFLQSVRSEHAGLTNALDECFDAHLPDDLTEPTSVQLAISVRADGTTAQAFAAPAYDVASAELATCIEQILGEIRYTAPDSHQLFRRTLTVPADDSELEFGALEIEDVTKATELEGLNKAVIRVVVRSWRSRLKECLSESTDESEPWGELVVQTLIPEQGRDIEASITESNIGNEGLESCDTDTFERMQFHRLPRDKDTRINYPLHYSPEE